MNDIFGKALVDYYDNPSKQKLITWTNLTDEDPVPVAYFFRTYKQMPNLEQKALALCKGSVLDIGCGSGSHSLYLQKNKSLTVTGLDQSNGAIEVAKQRGLSNTHCCSIYDFSGKKFDTLLMLMNGLGIAKTFNGVSKLLEHLKTLLQPNGSILVDSSDLIYLFDDDEKTFWLNDRRYYGEVDYGIKYKKMAEEFSWLYLDYDNLTKIASSSGFECEKIMEGLNFDYLACLRIKEY